MDKEIIKIYNHKEKWIGIQSYKVMSKEKALKLYPEHKEKIEKLSSN